MPNFPTPTIRVEKSTAQLNRRSLLRGAAIATVFAATPGRGLHAATWKPSSPVHVLVGYPAGGAVDTLVRIVGDGVQRTTGGVIVVEVRSGAYGVIAAQAASMATPDGYTLASGIMGMMSVLPAIPGSRIAMDLDRDLTPIMNLAGSAMVVVARPNAPFDDIDGLIAYAKSKPGATTYASSGPGSINHVAAAYIASEVGIEMLHVPYRGGAPATLDVMAGRIDVMVANVAEVAAMVEEGKIKALGVTAAHPSTMMPKAPPLALRFSQLDFNNWREQQTVQALAMHGLEPLFVSGSAFAEQIRSDRARWAAVAKNSNIRLE